MESQPNPYATPSTVPKTRSASDASRNHNLDLPLTFHLGFLDYVFLVPVCITTGLLFVGALASSMIRDDLGFLVVPISLLAMFSGAGFLGSFSALICTVRVDSKSITVLQLIPKSILFENIESWHFHPVTSCVVIDLVAGKQSLLISNRVMSRERSEMLGQVLQQYFGPAATVRNRDGSLGRSEPDERNDSNEPSLRPN